MFPYLSDLINYLFGFSFSFPLPMFGFMVAIAFIVANYLWVLEMKRKEQEGLLSSTIVRVIKGEKASLNELVSNGFFGFLLGYKILGVVLNYSEIIDTTNNLDLPGYVMSLQGSLIGGIGLAAVMTYLKYREAEKQRLPEPKEVEEVMHPYQHVGTMTFIAAIGGIFGAKVFDAIEDIDRLLADPIGVIVSGSGLSIYGGLIIGGIATTYYAYKKGLKLSHVIDSAAPSMIIGYAIGRIGCQLAGDGDWGMPNTAPKPEMLSFLPDWMWAFDYAGNVNNTDLGAAGRAVEVIEYGVSYIYEGNAWPTPFYETIMAFMIFGILWAFRKKIKVAGVMFSTYLIFNGVERFFIEKIRINADYSILGLEGTQAQIIAILITIAGGLGIWYAAKMHKKKAL
jgi:phosphatidylglycerol---prolipoprotein diacylglyceryl transferase